MASTENTQHSDYRSLKERRARWRELLIGLACAALFAGFGLLTAQIKASGLAATGIGPRFFPMALAVGGGSLSLVYCLFVLVSPRRGYADAVVENKIPASIVRPLATLVAPLVWVVLLPVLGFVLSTWAIMALLLLLFEGVRTRAWIIAPPVVTGGLWLIFEAILHVDLPKFALS